MAASTISLPVFLALALRRADRRDSDRVSSGRFTTDTRTSRACLIQAAKAHRDAPAAVAHASRGAAAEIAPLADELAKLSDKSSLAGVPAEHRAPIEAAIDGMIADRQAKIAAIDTKFAALTADTLAAVATEAEQTAAVTHAAAKVATYAAKPSESITGFQREALLQWAACQTGVDLDNAKSVGTLRWLAS